MNASDVHVRGLFSTFSKEYDDGALRVPVGLSRELMRVKGATTWVVLLDDTANTAKSLQALRDKLDPKQFQLVPWEELADMYIKTRDLFLRQVFIVEMLIGLIIVLSIGNTLHMAVVERTGEIGTAMALEQGVAISCGSSSSRGWCWERLVVRRCEPGVEFVDPDFLDRHSHAATSGHGGRIRCGASGGCRARVQCLRTGGGDDCVRQHPAGVQCVTDEYRGCPAAPALMRSRGRAA
jgi:hypothetical protein